MTHNSYKPSPDELDIIYYTIGAIKDRREITTPDFMKQNPKPIDREYYKRARERAEIEPEK